MLDLQFFDFQTTKLEHTLVLPSTAVSLQLQRDSGLLGVSCDDMVVRIVDTETRKVVREFGGSRGRVLDFVSTSYQKKGSHIDDPRCFCPDLFS